MTWLNIFIIISGCIHIVSAMIGKKQYTYVAKPLTMLLIITMAYYSIPATDTSYRNFILVGLLFSLMGDIFLMLPKEKFIPGLVSFLFAHIIYTIAFLKHYTASNLWIITLLLLVGVVYTSYLWSSLKSLKVPVLLYVFAILLMGYFAISWGLMSNDGSGLYAAAGAILFMFSDGCLAFRKFKGAYKWSPVMIMGTYFSAQWLIAHSIN